MFIAPPERLVVDAPVFLHLPQAFSAKLRVAFSLRILLTDVAREELRRRHKIEAFEAAIQRSELEIVSLTNLADLCAAHALQSAGLGEGEATSIIAAHRCEAALALDDAVALRQAKRAYPSVPLLVTQQVLDICASASALSVEDRQIV